MKLFATLLLLLQVWSGQALLPATNVRDSGPPGRTVPLDDLDHLLPTLENVKFRRAVATTERKRDRPSPLFSRLQRIPGQPGTHSVASTLKRLALPDAGQSSTAVAAAATQPEKQSVRPVGDYSAQYAVQCNWDDEKVWLLFDTGSSDTWAARSSFRCHAESGRVTKPRNCHFGHPLVEHFGHGAADDVHFRLKYGDGEMVWGPMGFSDLTCGGLKVDRQQVGLANNTLWHGDNTTVGILGLAYPSITNAFYGHFGDEAEYNAVTYTPFLTNAVSQGNIDPVFSVAIMRNSSDGVLAWGGLPPMELYDADAHAETDLVIANLVDKTETAWRYSFYTIIPDGIRWGGTLNTNKYPYIIDTGTTLMYLPPPLAEAIAMAFEPRAVFLYEWGGYFAPCDAVAPSMAVVISGVEFWINPADMIFKDLVDPLTGYCSIAVSTGEAGPYILGDVFLQNVLAVFDVGAAQMRFYKRK